MDLYSLIVAGGTGKRMGSDIPKQFLELNGKPILMHTIGRFSAFDNSIRIIVVLPEDQFDLWEFLKRKHSFPVPHATAIGGPTRFYSVKHGLELADKDGLVAIHDGVRPLVSTATIGRCFEEAEKFGNAIPVVSNTSSLRLITGDGSVPVSRQDIVIVQTPQVFRTGLIRNAYMQDYSEEFTDDATVLEKTGEKIRLVNGNRENIKITNPEDLLLASALLPEIT
ncbi:MAG: 2-C-methyl-D-erythritol 4-phosphate cytidylyltransferase [Bacteroidales bacterium]|nr:2-C-methyl-D-erythritol 4-phosphate cytidylyltransferase [Bacteroidales bacterium]